MHQDNRFTSLLIEMVGSVAICGLAYGADILLGLRRRRAGQP